MADERATTGAGAKADAPTMDARTTRVRNMVNVERLLLEL